MSTCHGWRAQYLILKQNNLKTQVKFPRVIGSIVPTHDDADIFRQASWQLIHDKSKLVPARSRVVRPNIVDIPGLVSRAFAAFTQKSTHRL
jgi:hypothetical protein